MEKMSDKEIKLLKIIENLSDEKGIVWYWDIEDLIGAKKKTEINAYNFDDIIDSLEEKGYVKACTEKGRVVANSHKDAEYYKIIKKLK